MIFEIKNVSRLWQIFIFCLISLIHYLCIITLMTNLRVNITNQGYNLKFINADWEIEKLDDCIVLSIVCKTISQFRIILLNGNAPQAYFDYAKHSFIYLYIIFYSKYNYCSNFQYIFATCLQLTYFKAVIFQWIYVYLMPQ